MHPTSCPGRVQACARPQDLEHHHLPTRQRASDRISKFADISNPSSSHKSRVCGRPEAERAAIATTGRHRLPSLATLPLPPPQPHRRAQHRRQLRRRTHRRNCDRREHRCCQHRQEELEATSIDTTICVCGHFIGKRACSISSLQNRLAVSVQSHTPHSSWPM